MEVIGLGMKDCTFITIITKILKFFDDQTTSLGEQPVKAIRARGICLTTLSTSYPEKGVER